MRYLLIISVLISLCNAQTNLEEYTKKYLIEPTYTSKKHTELMNNLVSFYSGNELIKDKKEQLENIATELKKANIRLANKGEIKITTTEVINLTEETVTVVIQIIHPLVPHFALNTAGSVHRAYILKPKEKLKRDNIGYGKERNSNSSILIHTQFLQ